MNNFFIVNDSSYELKCKRRSLKQWPKQVWIVENPVNNVHIVLKKFAFPEQSQF